MPAPIDGYTPGSLRRGKAGLLHRANNRQGATRFEEEFREETDAASGGSDYEMLHREEEDPLPTFKGRTPKSCLGINPDTDNFNLVVGLVIAANAVLIGLETDVSEYNSEYSIFEHVFCAFFALEVVVRVAKHKWVYFQSGSHLFDLFLVITGAASLYVVPLFSHADAKGRRGGSMWVNTLRLLRLLRVLRILRVFRLFSELSLILRAFLRALSTVMWIGILKVILDYVLAVFLTQVVGKSAHLWGEHQESIHTWFGSIGSSMRTLFIVMTLAEWDSIAWTLMEVYPAMVVFPLFIAYIITGSYTTMSLVTGIISQSLLTAQHQDESHRLAEMEEERLILSDKLRAFLAEADVDHSGFLTREEVKTAFRNNPGFIKRLAVVDINTDYEQLDRIFDKVDDGNETGMAIDTVAEAMLELNGAASASSIFELKTMVAQLRVDLFERMSVMHGADGAQAEADGKPKRLPRAWSVLANEPEMRGGPGAQSPGRGGATPSSSSAEKTFEARLEAKLDAKFAALAETLQATLRGELPEVKVLQSQLDARLDDKLEQLDARLEAKLDAKLASLAIRLLRALRNPSSSL